MEVFENQQINQCLHQQGNPLRQLELTQPLGRPRLEQNLASGMRGRVPNVC